MKALGSRIDRLYEEEAERWKAAWQQFHRTLWSHLTYDEQRAYSDLYSPDQTGEHDEAIEAMMRGWAAEVKAQFPESKPASPEDLREADAFFDAFFAALPASPDRVDLTRWPEDLPYPPDDSEAARKEEDALVKLCRREKGKGEVERLTAAHLIMNVAVCRTARSYSSVGSPR